MEERGVGEEEQHPQRYQHQHDVEMSGGVLEGGVVHEDDISLPPPLPPSCTPPFSDTDTFPDPPSILTPAAKPPPWRHLLSEKPLLLQIFSRLSPQDLCHVSLVCRTWDNVASSNKLWLPLCVERGWERCRLPHSRLRWKTVFSSLRGDERLDAHRWKLRYGQLEKVDRHFLRGTWTHKVEITTHVPYPPICAIFPPNRDEGGRFANADYVVTALGNQIVNIYHATDIAILREPTILFTVPKHICGAVWSLFLDRWRVFVGCSDGTIHIYHNDWAVGKSPIALPLRIPFPLGSIVELGGRKGPVPCIQVEGDVLVAGGSGVLVYDLSRGERVAWGDLGPRGFCKCLHFDDRRLVTGGGTSIRVWDLWGSFRGSSDGRVRVTPRLECTFSWEEDTDILCLQLQGGWLWTGSASGSVKVWDVSTGMCLRVVSGHAGPCTCMHGDRVKLATGGGDGVVNVYSPLLPEGKELCCTLYPLGGPISAVCFCQGYLVCSDSRGVFSVYSFWSDLL